MKGINEKAGGFVVTMVVVMVVESKKHAVARLIDVNGRSRLADPHAADHLED